MKPHFTFALLTFLAELSFAQWQAPEVPEGLCVEEVCTREMKRIYDGFQKNAINPQFIPGMYSGVCYHQSRFLNPETPHFLGVMFDRFEKGFYMAPILQYFGEENSMAGWTLEQARKESSPVWKDYGPMKLHPTSATQVVLDEEGSPFYAYWARQNVRTKALYFLVFSRGWSFAFCEAFPNAGGLENELMGPKLVGALSTRACLPLVSTIF